MAKKPQPGSFEPGNKAGEATQFKPGQSGNPGGKPVAARNRITTAFLHALAEDFDAHGKKAIARTRTEDPGAYMKVCAGLLPKQIEQTNPLDDLTDAQLYAAIALLQSQLAGDAQAGAGEADGTSQTH
jgi:hypothetical protein